MEADNSNSSEKNYFIIKAINAPIDFFENRDAAKKYFRRFGRVKIVSFKPKTKSILVEYTNDIGMQNALELAGEYNGKLFSVVQQTESIIRRRKSEKTDPDPEWNLDSDVLQELEAMGAFVPQKTYDFRPKKMDVDLPEVIVKPKQRRKDSPMPQKRRKDEVTPAESSLLAVIAQPGHNIEDKYRILDARDKLIRIRLKKMHSKKSKATEGTCPDMCPEKERLMRVTQHQVALYEQDSTRNGMNPRLAIKQYSRSSADQESPLASELRPVQVLEMTMGYLMHRILDLIDREDVNLAEWFHFLWDRMRGIRKDITQQEMCCPGSVALVEQCARFHIFCSARLVAEDPSVFDQKINTENLTKCLQTLKYMYHDLQLKGVSSPMEAEFRAYIILLNLNDGNFMWEVQHLKREIQESPEVKFAISVYSSLDKKNYVKFFKLVRSTTFLNACILMRYFMQVRLNALKTLLKSYSPRISQHSLPISYLTAILAFENDETTIEFIETYGLYTSGDGKKLMVLDKTAFASPEYSYVLDRAINLVESKRSWSVGQVVNGKFELPSQLFVNHQPQNSFDLGGYLIWENERHPELITAKIAKPVHPVELPVAVQSVVQPKSALLPPPPSQNSANLWSKPPATFFTQKPSVFDSNSVLAHQTIKPALPKPDVEELARIRHEKELEIKAENERIRIEKVRKNEEERQHAIKAAAEVKRAQLEKLMIAKREMEKKQKQLEILQIHHRALEAEKEREIQTGVSLTLQQLLDDVVEKVKEEKLAQLRDQMHKQMLLRFVNKWRVATRLKRKRKAIDFNPRWCNASMADEALELRTSTQTLTISNRKRYKHGSPGACDVPAHLAKSPHKLNLTKLTFDILSRKLRQFEHKIQRELFWKVNVSLPDSKQLNGVNFLENQLEKLLDWRETDRNVWQKIEQSQLHHQTITYCIERANEVDSTFGFIFIAQDLTHELRQRIGLNLRNFGVFFKLPIVLILRSNADKEGNLNFVRELQAEGIISTFSIWVNEFTAGNLRVMIAEALTFLAQNVEKAPPVEMDVLQGFLRRNLAEFWQRINSTMKWNAICKQTFRCPANVIELFNEAVFHLKEIVTNKVVHECGQFPAVFRDFLPSEIPESLPCDWRFVPDFVRSVEYVDLIARIFAEFRIGFAETWPVCDEMELELSLSKFCTKTIKNKPEKCFYRLMSIFLRHLEAEGDAECSFQQKIERINWIEIIDVISNEKLNEIDFSLDAFANRSVFNQVVVVYDVGTLDAFTQSDWFFNKKVKLAKDIKAKEDNKLQVVEEEEEEEEAINVDELFARTFGEESAKQIKKAEQLTSEVKECYEILDDLTTACRIHQKILEKSGEYLTDALHK